MLFRALLILLAAATTATAAPRTLKMKTLRPKERLARPWFRVPVKPTRFPDAKPGETVTERHADGTSRTYLLVEGDPDRGEPPLSLVSLDVLSGRVGGLPVLFFDFDADGAFLTPDRDFLVPVKKGPPCLVAPVVVLGRKVFQIRYDEAARTASAEEDRDFTDSKIFPGWTDVADGLARLNEVRGRMNLPPVALDREASRAAMLHLRYNERNGGNGHMEERDRTGYTREGAAAGLNSIGWNGGGSVASTVDGHLGSLLHRMDLIDPTITRVGIAARGSRIWIHTECGKRRPWEGQGPVIFPGPDRSWITGAYSGDNPDPRPEPTKAGLPVTVSWFGQEEGIRQVRVELRTRRGRMDCWKNDADSRDLKTNHASLRATLMPKTTLTSGLLTLTWKQHGHPCRLEHRFQIKKP